MPLGQDAASSGSDTATPVLARCGPATPAGRPARAGIESRKVRFNFPKPREAPAAVPRAAGLQGPPAAHRPLRRVAAHPTRALGKSSVMEAKDLQEELTCSICLDYFKDPVSIECGHNFCRCCLQRSWEPGGGQFPCPECRQLSSPAALRPNWVLARLTRTVRPGRQGPVPPGLCGRHWEPLRLFCEEDQRPVCLVCRESQEHQTHTMAPIDEAFENYREKLLKTQCDLKAKMKEAMRLHDMEVKSVTDWQNKMKNKRLSLSAEYAKLHRFLAEEEQLFLQRLSKEEEETKKKWNENSLRLNQIITSLKELILEVWEKSQCSSLELLQNPKDLLTRSENQDVNYSLEDLKVTSVCHIPMMKEMLKQVQVAVSLAEDTAHPELVFSLEGRYVKNGASGRSWPLFSAAWTYFIGRRNPQQNTHFVERFQHVPCVLGKNVFTSGQHYWEVESRDGLEIAVGVCQEDVMGIVDKSEMFPHGGIWAICWSSAGYWPLTGSSVSPTKQEPALHRVGVFLDHGAGDISFYNAVDGVHLHTFSCSLVSPLRPFFWLGPLASLVIPPVTGGK
ncbi:tripartite motif containing 4 [Rhinolophus ferrumequinum]|uniref:Tripartite motif containing 4 n=2 Tax=Rhinolophus ferrumequinum TaxID=59479 RepID=A0A671DZV4_RHIFE|nr:E3 ubiquitin-protein ligase TRIM4 isoform X2 [Rhinolophus ferrumequinum]KAF6357691.1 tripartite motif containing 4 [Rhinolophus ferrumequinum]